ncbi:MAG: hypothetical protein V1882_07725 [Candidatus Omnitrophota bacterium]
MKPIRSSLLTLFCALSLVLTPRLLLASTNAQPWGEQEAERDAQEEVTSEEKSAQEEMSSSVYGQITNISQDMRTLSLLPTDQVENKEEEDDDQVTSQDYYFRSETPITGMGSLSELSAGDYVNLEYYTFRDQNRITEISFDKHGETQRSNTEGSGTSTGVLVG